MSQGALSAEGLGSLPESLLEEGLQRATDYFIRRQLSPTDCYAAYLEEADRMFSSHWMAAELQANTVLWSDPRYKDARIMLGIEPLETGSEPDGEPHLSMQQASEKADL